MVNLSQINQLICDFSGKNIVLFIAWNFFDRDKILFLLVILAILAGLVILVGIVVLVGLVILVGIVVLVGFVVLVRLVILVVLIVLVVLRVVHVFTSLFGFLRIVYPELRKTIHIKKRL